MRLYKTQYEWSIDRELGFTIFYLNWNLNSNEWYLKYFIVLYTTIQKCWGQKVFLN